MSHQRTATVNIPCPGCVSFAVKFEMSQDRLDGGVYSCRQGTCSACGRQRFCGLRVGVSAARPEGGSPLNPDKCHYEVPTDTRSGKYAQCSYKEGKGPAGRCCTHHARKTVERQEAAARFAAARARRETVS